MEWEVIHTYTRAQALEDGVLCDITPAASAFGIKLHTAMTTTAWHECVEGHDDEDLQRECLAEVLRMFRLHAMGALLPLPGSDQSVLFYRVFLPKGRPTVLRAVCGPDDEGKPCLTIMLEGED